MRVTDEMVRAAWERLEHTAQGDLEDMTDNDIRNVIEAALAADRGDKLTPAERAYVDHARKGHQGNISIATNDIMRLLLVIDRLAPNPDKKES